MDVKDKWMDGEVVEDEKNEQKNEYTVYAKL